MDHHIKSLTNEILLEIFKSLDLDDISRFLAQDRYYYKLTFDMIFFDKIDRIFGLPKGNRFKIINDFLCLDAKKQLKQIINSNDINALKVFLKRTSLSRRKIFKLCVRSENEHMTLSLLNMIKSESIYFNINFAIKYDLVD